MSEVKSQILDTKTSAFEWKGAKFRSSLYIFIIGGGLWIMPTPEGLSDQAWHLFAIFVATIAGVILRPLPCC